MRKLSFFRDYLIEKYGKPLYRIPVDLGFSCPHRTRSGKGGCIFCSEDGSRARHLEAGLSLREQVERGKEYLTRRYQADSPYIAYFQAFTGTNADVPTLRRLYSDVLAMEEFKVVIIATRPDCLPDDCLDFLEELSRQYELWIELGVQTANDATLKKINRGHDFASVEHAVRCLHKRGIKVAAHLILGLPDETSEDWLETARKIKTLPFSAVKLHNLLVLKGTELAKLYEKSAFPVLNEYEYAEALALFLRELPDSMMLMRISAEAPENQIIAPRWWMKKGQFLNFFENLYSEEDAGKSIFHACKTDDGSYTLYHPRYRQHFHSTAGAWLESQKKYLDPCHVRETLQTGENVSLLDVGFGMGYNACAAIELAETVKRGKIYITSLELDRNVLEAALNLPEHPGKKILDAIRKNGRYESSYASLDILWGDARDSVRILNGHYDYIFLDAFSTESNPELWTFDFIRHLKERLKDQGFLATYASAYPLLGALLKNGFTLYESKAFGRRRGGIVAAIHSNPWLPPLSEKDYNIAEKSTAGTPYRDRTLKSSRNEILAARKVEVERLRSEGIPKWYNPKHG